MVDNILQTWKKKMNWIKIETQEKQKEKKGWKQICIRVLYEKIKSQWPWKIRFWAFPSDVSKDIPIIFEYLVYCNVQNERHEMPYLDE